MAASLDTTLGMVEIALVVGAALLGISLLQTHFYYRSFPGDRHGIKILVAAVCTVDILHTALLAHATYHYTITNFGNYEELGNLPVSLTLSLFFVAVVTVMVQGFFSYRVYVVTKSWIPTFICASLTICRFCFSSAATGKAFALARFVRLESDYKWGIGVSAAFGAATDAFTAATLCIGLARNRSGMDSTNKIIDKVIAYTISTGLLTSILAVAELICFLSMENSIWLAMYSTLPKLFSNSLLTSLNARISLRDDISKSQGRSTVPDSPFAGSFTMRAPVRIQMETVITKDAPTTPDPTYPEPDLESRKASSEL